MSDSRELKLERVVEAPRDLLWMCWTEPKHLMPWFCPKPWTVSECRIDLKPGGEFIAMDHAANAGAPSSTGGTIHRIDPAIVLASAKAAGLVFVEKSDVLANPQDDRSKMVFDATIRRHTDQFLFRFRKPS